jgi:hypothetical protein
MRRSLALWLVMLGVAAIVAVVVYIGPLFYFASREDSLNDVASINRSSSSSAKPFTRSHTGPESATPEEPAWLSEARNDPDPRVRLNAIEAWARNPTTSLDPVTYALVDPDESVRTRAQGLLEDALARR